MVSYILVYLFKAYYYLQIVSLHYTFPPTCRPYQTTKTREATYKRNAEVGSRNHCCNVKAISITNSEYMSVALFIHHAKRLGCSMSSVACLALPYFST